MRDGRAGSTELKAGYKQTAVGPIPDDWTFARVSAAAAPVPNAIVGGPFGSDLVSADYVSDGVPVIRGQNMGQRYVEPPFVFVSSTKAALLMANIARPGDVIFTQRGTLGQVSLVPREPYDRYLVSQSQMKVTLNSDLLDARYFCYLFSGPVHQKLIRTNTIQTGVPHINLGVLRQLPILIPPPSEQQAIALALSDLDALLGSLDRLIAKQVDLKQAAMRQLLMGQTRLPTFSRRWEVALLGNLGRWFSGGTPSMANEDYWSGDIPWISPKDMKVTRLHNGIDHVSPAALSNGTRLLPEGALLIVVRGMILVHSCPVARAERPLAFNQDIKGLVVRPDVDSNFLLWWLVANEATLLSTTTVSTHGTKRVATETLFKLEVSLPQLPEQRAIAAVLSDMDAEIAALEQRRDKTRLLKQAMMQELLTGRTRLV